MHCFPDSYAATEMGFGTLSIFAEFWSPKPQEYELALYNVMTDALNTKIQVNKHFSVPPLLVSPESCWNCSDFVSALLVTIYMWCVIALSICL